MLLMSSVVAIFSLSRLISPVLSMIFIMVVWFGVGCARRRAHRQQLQCDISAPATQAENVIFFHAGDFFPQNP
jgi:hypothetical protein